MRQTITEHRDGTVTRKVVYDEVKNTRKVRIACQYCGAKKTRQTTIGHTVNPFNRKPNGDAKTRAEVSKDVTRALDAWAAEMRDTPFTCDSCDYRRTMDDQDERILQTLLAVVEDATAKRQQCGTTGALDRDDVQLWSLAAAYLALITKLHEDDDPIVRELSEAQVCTRALDMVIVSPYLKAVTLKPAGGKNRAAIRLTPEGVDMINKRRAGGAA